MQEETPMIREKRERLEAAGWKVGSAAEFLDLSEEEQVIVAMRAGRGSPLGGQLPRSDPNGRRKNRP